FNSGANRLVEDGAGSVTLDTLDNLYPTEIFDLIKIDVEGMELDVLLGGEQLIRRSRPTILIEVSNANKGRFFGWLARMNYRVHRAFELVHASNYLIAPEALRANFYANGLVKTVIHTPAVPLAPEQPPLGWSAQELLRAYSDTPMLELTLSSGRYFLDSQPVELDSLATPLHGKALLLREILGQLNIEQFQSLLLAIDGVRNIVLFAPMDARWYQAGFTPGHVLDA